MNFDKESKSEDFFFFWGGGGGGGAGGAEEREGGGGRGFQPKKKKTQKNNRYSLILCAHALYKISSSWLKLFSGFNTTKRTNGQVRGQCFTEFSQKSS